MYMYRLGGGREVVIENLFLAAVCVQTLDSLSNCTMVYLSPSPPRSLELGNGAGGGFVIVVVNNKMMGDSAWVRMVDNVPTFQSLDVLEKSLGDLVSPVSLFRERMNLLNGGHYNDDDNNHLNKGDKREREGDQVEASHNQLFPPLEPLILPISPPHSTASSVCKVVTATLDFITNTPSPTKSHKTTYEHSDHDHDQTD